MGLVNCESKNYSVFRIIFSSKYRSMNIKILPWNFCYADSKYLFL